MNLTVPISVEELLEESRKGNRRSQQDLFQKYHRKFYAVCYRYLQNQAEAEDVMMTAFHKIFSHPAGWQGQGSAEGWMKRIVINQALMEVRKSKPLYAEVSEAENLNPSNDLPDQNLHAEDLMKMLSQLPSGYRTVFNLYAIEGFAHNEIAEMLGISEGTSKSQLSRARVLLQQMVLNHQKSDNRLYGKQ